MQSLFDESLAQLVEHIPFKDGVEGSNPSALTQISFYPIFPNRYNLKAFIVLGKYSNDYFHCMSKILIPNEAIVQKIYTIRGQKVMIDRDLAELYEVETKVLKQAVNRNIDIFPEHFMFELTKEEFHNLRSQIVTSSWGGQRNKN